MLKKPHKLRVVLLGAMFVLVAAAVGARLYDLQILNHQYHHDRATRQQTQRVVVQAQRGDILDRKGRPLATSTGTLSLYVQTKYFQPPEASVDLVSLASHISYYTGKSPAQTLRLLSREGVVPLGRQLEPTAAQSIGEMIAEQDVRRRGYWFHRESKRLYPRHLAPHVIGFCGTDGDGDNKGLDGLEFRYNEMLQGQRIEASASRSGISQVMEPVPHEDLLAARGNTLVLTLDAAIQEAAEEALTQAAADYEPTACGAIVQDVNTGEILAMASWPTYDNGDQGAYPADSRRNRLLTDPLETGSVAKLFTSAILLDTGKISLDTLIDCEGGRAVIEGRRVTDAPGHYLNISPFYEVIRYSSNVGTIKAAQALENNEWYGYLRAFGFGQKTGVDLPGEGTGILYHPSSWTKFSRSSLPMGYEIAFTPIQIVNAVSSLVNGGELLKPRVVSEVYDARGNLVWQSSREVIGRPIRPSTSALLREIMEDVVLHGTGTKAQVPGFRVGGKTGTTVKSHIFTHKEYIASFAGVLPIDEPRVAIYCFVDNPQGAHYASTVAAPVFQKIARAAVLHLGLVPSSLPDAENAAGDSQLVAAEQSFLFSTAADHPIGTMPDMTGMTMAEVRRELHPLTAKVRFIGSGRAGDQRPRPGERLNPAQEAIVVFYPDTDRASALSRHSLYEARKDS